MASLKELLSTFSLCQIYGPWGSRGLWGRYLRYLQGCYGMINLLSCSFSPSFIPSKAVAQSRAASQSMEMDAVRLSSGRHSFRTQLPLKGTVPERKDRGFDLAGWYDARSGQY